MRKTKRKILIRVFPQRLLAIFKARFMEYVFPIQYHLYLESLTHKPLSSANVQTGESRKYNK